MLSQLMKNAPVIGSAYGFVKTAHQLYNCTTPAGAVVTATKGIILDCTPPLIKYPALCALCLSCSVVGTCTGNPLVISAAITLGEAIVES